jgi:hypothetical protein
METFQKIVLYSAIIILILALVVIGVLITSKEETVWPPVVPECPDWWKAQKQGDQSVCVNMKDLGICSAEKGQTHQIMNFNTPTFSGSNGSCAKYNWANKCNVSWDGITYGVSNPCDTSS